MAIAEHEVIDMGTGEVVESRALVRAAPLSIGEVLDRFANSGALQQQQRLVAAYDEACRALVGPNDVQVDGGREFKKKSAWRKLGRAFGISTTIVREDSHYDPEGYLVSTVIVRASAPWGQFAEAIGKCSTRESRFFKNNRPNPKAVAKADHDCPVTAQTRATNRAISDLIAAGEVSAEEIEGDNGESVQPWDKVMPFGNAKGKRLGDMSAKALLAAKKWCEEKDAKKFRPLILDIEAVLTRAADTAGLETSYDSPADAFEFPADQDDLPF